MKKSIISKGFIAAGIMNTMGILIFSKFFTNDVIPETDPIVMSNFGMLMIMIWGCAFIAVAKSYERVRWLVGVFILEKLAYVLAYLIWFSQNDIVAVYEKDVLAGVFYSVYGINDFLFMLFFAYVFIKVKSSQEIPAHLS